MNITMDKTSDVTARLKVEVVEADYKEKVNQELKKLARERQIPGFRKGHVPMGELQRRFGRQMASDVINHEVIQAVYKYIEENHLAVLGEPVPVEVVELDLKNEQDYTFEYDLALSPVMDIKLDSLKVPYYTIEVTDEMVKEQDENMRKRFGTQEPGEEFEKDSLVKGAIMELDADGKVRTDADAIQVTAGIVFPATFSDKAEAAKFDGAKVGSKVVFNPARAAGNNAAELSSMLEIDKERAAEVESDFEMAISEIIVAKPAQPGEEYYTNVFGPDKVKTEEEYFDALRKMMAAQLEPNSEQMFERDVTELLMQKYGDMELPAEVLKRWLVRNNEGLTEENIDAEFDKMVPGLKWQLVRDHIAAMIDLKVEDADMKGFAMASARQQFAQYGMTNVGDDILEDYAKRMLSDKEYRRKIYQTVADVKLYHEIKSRVDLEKKEVSLDEFKKLAAGPEAEAAAAE